MVMGEDHHKQRIALYNALRIENCFFMLFVITLERVSYGSLSRALFFEKGFFIIKNLSESKKGLRNGFAPQFSLNVTISFMRMKHRMRIYFTAIFRALRDACVRYISDRLLKPISAQYRNRLRRSRREENT